MPWPCLSRVSCCAQHCGVDYLPWGQMQRQMCPGALSVWGMRPRHGRLRTWSASLAGARLKQKFFCHPAHTAKQIRRIASLLLQIETRCTLRQAQQWQGATYEKMNADGEREHAFQPTSMDKALLTRHSLSVMFLFRACERELFGTAWWPTLCAWMP